MKKTVLKSLALAAIVLAFMIPAANVHSAPAPAEGNPLDKFRPHNDKKYADGLKTVWGKFHPQKTAKPPKQQKVKPSGPKQSAKPAQIPIASVIKLPASTLASFHDPVTAPTSVPGHHRLSVKYLGTKMTVNVPQRISLKVKSLSEQHIADAWSSLSEGGFEHMLESCRSLRSSCQLPDWNYLDLVWRLSHAAVSEWNEAELLAAWLAAASGYSVRLGADSSRLYALFGTKYAIFDKTYFPLDGVKYYLAAALFGSKDTPANTAALRISQPEYEGTRPFSLAVNTLPKLASNPAKPKTIGQEGSASAIRFASDRSMIRFYQLWPEASDGSDMMTQWSLIAQAPASRTMRRDFYRPLRKLISGKNPVEGANLLLNYVQRNLPYITDGEAWGRERTFFPEETLYYPGSDCEDRAILFSRMVRDLLGLRVVLLYYPGHLATAVAFPGAVDGDYIVYGGTKFTVCDPTILGAGAPVGQSMSGLDTSNVKIILLD